LGVLAAAGLATSSLYWSQAIIGEVYALHAALTALTLWAWSRPRRPPFLLGIVHGLSLTNHVTAGIALIAALAFVPRRPLRSLAPNAARFALGLVVPLSVYLLLPLRAAAHPASNWGDPSSPGRFLAHVTGRQYASYLDWRDVAETARDFAALVRLLVGDLPPWMIPAAIVGWPRVAALHRRYAWFTALLLAGTFLLTATYRTADRAPYLLPAYAVVAVWAAVGAMQALDAARAWAGGRLPRAWAVRGSAAAVLILALVWGVRAGARVDLHGDDSAMVFARATLAALPPGATYYSARDDVTFALWYAQRALGLRPDVRVVDVRAPSARGGQ
jgi:hypothetical protein